MEDERMVDALATAANRDAVLSIARDVFTADTVREPEAVLARIAQETRIYARDGINYAPRPLIDSDGLLFLAADVAVNSRGAVRKLIEKYGASTESESLGGRTLLTFSLLQLNEEMSRFLAKEMHADLKRATESIGVMLSTAEKKEEKRYLGTALRLAEKISADGIAGVART